MDKAYYPTIWENLPAETSPLDEINLNAISRGLNTVDDRVIDLDTRVKDTVNSVTFNSNTGVLRIIKDDGTDVTYNLNSRILATIDDIQQQNRVSFSEIAVNFQDVRTLLDNMDLKIDMTAEGANAGLRDVQTTIEENDGYYKREMSGIRDSVSSVEGNVDALDRYMTEYSSSIIQTTQAIQLQVQEVTQSVDDLGNAVDGNITILRSQINQQAGRIDLKVSKLEVIDDLQQEFAGSGISITPERIIFASTGSMVVNTTNFKLDEEGNAEFQGHVAMDSGSVGGVPIIASPGDSDSTLSVQHSHHSWKLRSAAMGENDERYYTYMTAGKHLVVTNTENGSVSSSNNVSDNCAIGSPNYPWKAGYFKNLRACTIEDGKVVRHNVIPEGLEITLLTTAWTRLVSGSNRFIIVMSINNMKPGRTFLSIAVETFADLSMVHYWHVEAACTNNGEVTFICSNPEPGETGSPGDNINIILLAEDYVIPQGMEAPELVAEWDEDNGQLICMWNTPDDSNRFVDWIGDYLVIEKYNETTGEWETEETFPSNGHFDKDAFENDKLIIGEVSNNG